MFNLFGLADAKVARPNKNIDSVVVSVDTLDKNIVFYRVSKLDFNNPEITSVPYSSIFLSETFLTEFELACAEYVSQNEQSAKSIFYFVMPDNMVMTDHLVLPAMKSDKQQSALKTQLDTLFKNKDLVFHHYVAVQTKQFSHYHLTIVNKNSLESLYKSASGKIGFKGTSYYSNCLINGLLHYNAGLRKKSFIFFNVKEDHTDVVVCIKGKTECFSTLMLGTDHLLDNVVLQENTLYDHDVADLAIINAKENAKRKQLTVSEDEDEDILLDLDAETEMTDAQAIKAVVDEAEKQMNDKALQNAAEDLGISAEQKAINDKLDAEEAEEAELERLDEEAIANMSPARRKKIFARKTPKRLPKFMLREEPTSPEGYVYENFRMFVKWALLYNKQLKDGDYLPELDCVLFSMPEQYKYVLEMVNENENAGVPFEYVGEQEQNVSDNLDKIGAVYMSNYNKRENF